MYCVSWTDAVPPRLTEAAIREQFAAFYSPEWMAGVRERWGSAPLKAEWVVPVVAESAEGRVVAEEVVAP